MRGLGDWEPPPEIAGYVQSFKLWWGAGKQVSAIEKRFYCKKHAITGQVDAILNMPDGQYIFDIKTSLNPSKTWPLQGSAYAYLARQGGYDIKGILFLKLDREGKIGREYRYEDEWEFYLKTLEVYKRFFAKKPRAKR